jgi:aminoglycoside 3-N-acetyltransferase
MTSGAPSPVELAGALRALGVANGDKLVVHSSLRAVGPVVGGPDGVVDALLDTLGPEGLLVAPAFTYDTSSFDPDVAPGRTGALSEALRHRPGAVRSLHPSHSVVALGPDAEWLCAGHEERAATDVDSPLDRLARAGGHVLLLGVGHVANTTVHVAEFRAEVPYLDIPFSDAWPRQHTILVGGASPLVVEYDRFPGCSRTFGIVERGLRERGAVRDGLVGRALAQLVDGEALIETTVEMLERDPGVLLCSDPSCYRCAGARAR